MPQWVEKIVVKGCEKLKDVNQQPQIHFGKSIFKMPLCHAFIIFLSKHKKKTEFTQK